jgi:hypothetical protein
MFQVVHMDIAKVDQDVTHCTLCYKHLFQMFHLFFETYIASVFLFECCICFTHMLQVFYLDVAYVLE